MPIVLIRSNLALTLAQMHNIMNAMADAVSLHVKSLSRMYIHFHDALPEFAWRFMDGKAIAPVGDKTIDCGSVAWQTAN
jgi:hypothetical protein